MFIHEHLLQFLLNLNFLEGFNHVTLLNIVAVGERDTTLKVGANLLHIVLKAFQRIDFAGKDYNTIANDARLVAALHLAINHVATCHITNLADVVNLAHLDVGSNLLLDNRLEHTLHGHLDVLNGIVDD